MAIFAKAVSGNPIINGGAVGHAPPPTNSGEAVDIFDYGKTGYNTLDVNDRTVVVLNAKYKAGATTGWERPGSDLA